MTRLGAGRSASSAASPLRVGSARRLGIPPQRCVCHRTRATGAPGLRCGHYGRYKGLGVAPSCRPPRPIPAAGAFARVLSAYPSIDSWADDASAYYPRCDNRMAQQGQIRSLRRVQGLPLGAGATRIPGTGWSCGLPAGRRAWTCAQARRAFAARVLSLRMRASICRTDQTNWYWGWRDRGMRKAEGGMRNGNAGCRPRRRWRWVFGSPGVPSRWSSRSGPTCRGRRKSRSRRGP